MHEGAETVAVPAGGTGTPGDEERDVGGREDVLAPGTHRARPPGALGRAQQEADRFVVGGQDRIRGGGVAAVDPPWVAEPVPALADALEVGGQACLLRLAPRGVDEGGANLVLCQWFHGVPVSRA